MGIISRNLLHGTVTDFSFGDTQEDHHKLRRGDNSDKIKIGCILYTGRLGFKKILITKFCSYYYNNEVHPQLEI
ncbi:hypothetical protein B7P43_G08582 [Cryptotermes secundus]|uniref:Uncharacterized protein n=1 Tax=Cryptotermes secundus TaxID=105785 RepID=A0A2J7PCE2_9NEOP|nr:hypothetical protein B7P43_G08582 [Cryptotermes secundus]